MAYEFEENEEIKQRRKDLANLPSPSAYSNTYANQVKDIYGKLNNRGRYNYNANNDEAYKQYAANYRALQGLAMANNQAQAQGLTGGYGSTYAPMVAQQGELLGDTYLAEQQPAFAYADQDVWRGKGNAMANQYGVASQMRDNEFQNYQNQMNAYNDAFKTKANALSDAYQNAYNIFKSDAEYDLREKANQNDYDLNVLRQSKAQAKGGSGGRGGRGGRSGGKSSGRGGKPTNTPQTKTTDVAGVYGITNDQLLSLGYGPISLDKFDKLVDEGKVAVYEDSNGNLQVKRVEPKRRNNGISRLDFNL